MNKAYFVEKDRNSFVGTDAVRGPWSPEACHAGPVAGLLARAAENLIPEKQLVRLTAVLLKPIPVAGFRLSAEVERDRRTIGIVNVRLIDDDGEACATASTLHLAAQSHESMPTAPMDTPVFEDAVPGPFPVNEFQRIETGFAGSVEIAYPPGEKAGPGPKTVWMRTPPLLDDEEPSPFQKLCPLADSGNGISYNATPKEFTFINPDITISCFRRPESDWLASSALSYWEKSGIGLATATLFDRAGPVASVFQTLVLGRRS